MAEKLTQEKLLQEAEAFAESESQHWEPTIYGVDNGKTIGTYLEHKLRDRLGTAYSFEAGSSARGIDFPELGIDVKVTRATQPQSSCPYSSADQKVYGVGHSLLVFVYEKEDDPEREAGNLKITHLIFVEAHRTGDYQTTRGILDILGRDANDDDLGAFILERNLPVDEIGARQLAARILADRPAQGYLTVSKALQWRLQFGHAIRAAGDVDGVHRLRSTRPDVQT